MFQKQVIIALRQVVGKWQSWMWVAGEKWGSRLSRRGSLGFGVRGRKETRQDSEGKIGGPTVKRVQSNRS